MKPEGNHVECMKVIASHIEFISFDEFGAEVAWLRTCIPNSQDKHLLRTLAIISGICFISTSISFHDIKPTNIISQNGLRNTFEGDIL